MLLMPQWKYLGHEDVSISILAMLHIKTMVRVFVTSGYV